MQQFINWLTGKSNSSLTTKGTILNQMDERRPLPMGDKEFEEWSERILSGALVPCKDKESLKFTLAGEIMHLGPTESHKEDAFFIHRLRKLAVNEVAIAKMNEIKAAKEKARLEKEQVEKEKAEYEESQKRHKEQLAFNNASTEAREQNLSPRG